jgi:thymidylate kinase
MTEARRGLFISFEGTDGSGKSTQMRLLAQRLRASGFTVLESAEPGGTPIGLQIRRILLDSTNEEMAPMTELLLMFASRAQAAAQWLEPALARGEIVLSDRYTDSSLAYQGEARGLGFDTVLKLHKLALDDLQPDLSLCIDVDPEEGLARAHGRNRSAAPESPNETRLDEQSLEFYRRVLDGYRKIASLEPDRFHIVDGRAAPEVIADRIWAEIQPLLARSSR